jgi:hypothetical protein
MIFFLGSVQAVVALLQIMHRVADANNENIVTLSECGATQAVVYILTVRFYLYIISAHS